MKFRSIAAFTWGAFFFAVGTLLLASGSASAHNEGTKKQISIKIEADSTLDFLKVSEQVPPQNCKDHPDLKGCFRLENNTGGLIRFHVQGAYKFTKFKICRVDPDYAEPNEPQETKETQELALKNRCGQNLSIDERLDFLIMNNKQGAKVLPIPENGEIDLTVQTDFNEKSFYLVDQNTIKQLYFYNIEACPVSGGKCLWFDPPIENTGTGGSN